MVIRIEHDDNEHLIPVHLVGSIPLASANDVFDLVGRTLSNCCRRFPDGETGERKNWIGWQLGVFAGQRALIQSETKDRDYQLHPPFTFRPNYGPDDLRFNDLGFAREASSSFTVFGKKQTAGVLPENAKFLVALPTPFAPVYSFTTYTIQDQVFQVYESAILSELGAICEMIPPEKLSIQWDVATEMSIFEGVYSAPIVNPWVTLMARLSRLGNAVPEEVDMGYHLCYGSMNNRHWKEPDDLGMCIKVANELKKTVSRQINFLHMPVPVDRVDDDYYEPLIDLEMDPATEVFLGLLHDTDSTNGNVNRLSIASKYLREFGIASECGLGRREPKDMVKIIEHHAEVSRQVHKTLTR